MLTDLFLHQVRCRPEATAAGYNGVAIDYATLHQRATALARLLAAQGVGSGDRVAVILPKNLDALATLLGISFTGAAYVPLDPRLPPERLVRTLVDCDARLLLTNVSTLDPITSIDTSLIRNYRAIVTPSRCSLPNAIEHDFEQKSSNYSHPADTSEDAPAYILYTSGSTGEPKGVVHTHRSAVEFINWAIQKFALGPDQRLANHAQFSFDLSILDIFGALSSGAAVELIQPEMLVRPKELVKKLNDWRISLLYAVPSAIALLESDGDLNKLPPAHLARILYAGEPFVVRQLRKVMQALPQATFYNLYGPTETNVCTYHPIDEIPTDDTLQIPIGRPCEHLTVELRDEQAHVTPPGAEGEICVAGPSVMLGYFARPEATSTVFYEAAGFSDGRVRYRTGDRAIVDETGKFWFLGRRDRMVKRRGYRIELGEIEAALSQSPSVSEAAVFIHDEAGEVRIRAAVVLCDGTQASALTLRVHCGRLLAPYMIPDSIKIIAQMPRTPNGKVDLKGLD
jgi:amino acid adenylation domain-containing protein